MHIPTIDPIEYHTLVGKLLHATQKRLNIIFDISYISHFMQAPQIPHLLVAQCVLKYLKDTINCKNIGKSFFIVSFTYVDFTRDIKQNYIFHGIFSLVRVLQFPSQEKDKKIKFEFP
jgi:hypothetical protein